MVKPGAPVLSWIFTAIAAVILILMFTFSFIRFHQRRRVKRAKEEEYITRLKMILPGFSYREMKKTQARKIMTNTHAVSLAELFQVPSSLQSSCSKLPELLGSPKFSEHPHSTAAFIHTATPQRSYPHLTGILINQNSNDTTTDDEKPLVGSSGHTDIKRRPGADRADNTFIKEHVQSNTSDQFYLSKRKAKPKVERRKQTSELSTKNNFVPMSVQFSDREKQNYIVYSPNDPTQRRESEPELVQTHQDTATSSSAQGMYVSKSFVETNVKPAKVKSKHGKGHKADRQTRRYKKSLLMEHRPRSLPQLDDVYYANVVDDSIASQGDLHGHGEGTWAMPTDNSASIDIDTVFTKRKHLVGRSGHAVSDPTIPMSSFPLVSQSEEFNEKYQTFNSEYM